MCPYHGSIKQLFLSASLNATCDLWMGLSDGDQLKILNSLMLNSVLATP